MCKGPQQALCISIDNLFTSCLRSFGDHSFCRITVEHIHLAILVVFKCTARTDTTDNPCMFRRWLMLRITRSACGIQATPFSQGKKVATVQYCLSCKGLSSIFKHTLWEGYCSGWAPLHSTAEVRLFVSFTVTRSRMQRRHLPMTTMTSGDLALSCSSRVTFLSCLTSRAYVHHRLPPAPCNLLPTVSIVPDY
ncbi:hypothetical protein BKA93DRAFT_572896 [Sparassis latifolia]